MINGVGDRVGVGEMAKVGGGGNVGVSVASAGAESVTGVAASGGIGNGSDSFSAGN